MTRKKKPSIKNRTWEKDRRDRLNKSFDQLAQLLPQYDPSITWTKAEIIQKSIEHIQDLHSKHRNYLQEKDSEALKCYDELIFCLNFFQSRNKQLFELLQNAKIPVPSVKVPKFLIDNPLIGEENNFNNLNTKKHGRPQKYANQLKEDNANKSKKTTSVPKDAGKCVSKTSSSLGSPTKENLNEGATTPEPTRPNESIKQAVLPSKVVPQIQTATISTGVLLPLIPCSASVTSTAVTNYTPTISSAGSFQPVINAKNISSYRKCKIMNIQTISKGLKLAKDKDGNIKLMPRPTMKIHFRRSDGKLPIPILKRKIAPIKRTRKRKCIQKSAKCDEKSIKKTNLACIGKQKIVKEEINTEKPIIPNDKKSLKTLDKPIFSPIKAINPPSPKKCVSENCIKSSDQEILTNDYFSTLQIPQNETNPESLSPTAAFLLTFPVVSTAGGKNPDHDETVFLNNNLVTEDTRKDNETCAADSLENLNTFFTTKEYHKYCERVDESKAQQKKDIAEKDTTINYPNSTLVSKSKNVKMDTTSIPHNNSNAVPYSETSICSTTKSSYYPIQNQYSSCSSNPSNFTFNLTSNTPSTVVSSASDSMRQSVCTYSSKMSDLPWTPTVTTNYTSSFTFSLTPSTTVYTNTVANGSYTNVSSSSSTHLNNLPPSTLSEAIPKSSFVSFDYPKLYNSSFPRINHSYSTSTNFTFSLTNPKNSITNSLDSSKTILTSTNSNLTKSLQPSYTSYCFDSQTQFSQKETTNFTFALTRPTSSATTSQTAQENMFLNNSTISTTSSALVDSGKKPPIITSHSIDYEKPIRQMDITNNQKFLNKQSDAPVTNSLFCYDSAKSTKLPQKNHINWMTSSEYLLPPVDIGPTTTTPSIYQSQITTASDNRGKRNEISFPHINSEDNLSAWSPSKVIDTSHLMPSATIPNYYSDLTFNPNYSGTNIFEVPKPHNIRSYEQEKIEKSYKTSSSVALAPTTTNQSNFFSVSQLVDQGIGSSSKVYDSCNKKSTVNKSKDIRKHSDKSYDAKSSYRHDPNHPANAEQYLYHEPQKPTVSNTYSAEALISKKEKHRNYTSSYNGNPDFYSSIDGVTGSSNIYAADNVDHNYNPNYFYNYVPSQNFTQETDYLGAYCTDVQYGKNHNNKSQYTFTNSQRSASAVMEKADNKKLVVPPTVHPPPTAPTYDTNYFPVPLTANSAMIPAPPPPPPPPSDMYDPHHYSHSSSFQPGNWTAKNTLPVYHSQQTISNGDLTSTNYNSGSTVNQGVSGNLTNFNLSTICPEINDKVINNSNW